MKKKNIGIFLSLLVLCLGLLFPAQATETVLFTAVNDNLLALNDETMPVWSGGVLYVPYTVFDGNNTSGVNFGISSSYNKSAGSMGLYTLQQMMVFDLNQGICYNGLTDEVLAGRAFLRNGRPYVPVALVCDFFGLNYSIISINQGQIIRIKNSAVVLSDLRFVDAASNLIATRLREYQQATQSPPAPGVRPPSVTIPDPEPLPPEEPEEGGVLPIYLGFRCEDTQGLTSILDTLDRSGRKGIFFFSPEGLSRQDTLLDRLLGTGHRIGLIGTGETAEQTKTSLEEANQLLAQEYFTQSHVVLSPKGQQKALAEDGWICWQETLSAVPKPEQSSASYGNSVMRALEGHSGRVYLTLDGGTETARMLPYLLYRIEEQGWQIKLPLETRL